MAGGRVWQQQLPERSKCCVRQVQHHRKFRNTTAFGKNFGMARIVMPGKVQRLFIERSRHNGVDMPGQRKVCRKAEAAISGISGRSADDARGNRSRTGPGRVAAGEELLFEGAGDLTAKAVGACFPPRNFRQRQPRNTV